MREKTYRIRNAGSSPFFATPTDLTRMASDGTIGTSTEFWSNKDQCWKPIAGVMVEEYPERLQQLRSSGFNWIKIGESKTGRDCPACLGISECNYPIESAPILPPEDCTCTPWCRLTYRAARGPGGADAETPASIVLPQQAWWKTTLLVGLFIGVFGFLGYRMLSTKRTDPPTELLPVSTTVGAVEVGATSEEGYPNKAQAYAAMTQHVISRIQTGAKVTAQDANEVTITRTGNQYNGLFHLQAVDADRNTVRKWYSLTMQYDRGSDSWQLLKEESLSPQYVE